MEKIAIQIWKNHEINDDDFKSFLLNEIPSNLKSDLTSYQVNLPDKDVSKAAGLVQSSYPVSYTHLTLPTKRIV